MPTYRIKPGTLFTRWNGGEQPIPDDTLFFVCIRSGPDWPCLTRSIKGLWRWNHDGSSTDIIKYLVVDSSTTDIVDSIEYGADGYLHDAILNNPEGAY
jgi:hypothetical protein